MRPRSRGWLPSVASCVAMDSPCAVHPEVPAVTRCGSCRRALCKTCWTHDVDDVPWCAGCVAHLEDRSPAALPLAFVGAALSLLAAPILAFRDEPMVVEGGVATALAILITGGFLYRRNLKIQSGRFVHRRDPESQALPPSSAPRGYRAPMAPPVVRALAPPVSGEIVALLVLVSLVLPTALVPSFVRLPMWVEVEVVFATWWLVWTLTFTWLLFRGQRIADDGPTARDAKGGSRSKSGSSGGNLLDGLDAASVPDGEGCAAFVMFVVVVALLFLTSWVMGEFIIPALFLLAYFVVTRALRHVVNDEHECAGRPLVALAWGAIWATLYTAPLALIPVILHAALAH